MSLEEHQLQQQLKTILLENIKLKANIQERIGLSGFLPWRHFNKQQTEELLSTVNMSRIRDLLHRFLGLDERYPTIASSSDEDEAAVSDAAAFRKHSLDHLASSSKGASIDPHVPADPQNPKRRQLIITFLMQILQFAKQQRFNDYKTSTLCSVFYVTHMACCERPGPPPGMSSCFSFFQELLLKHSVERPPFSVAVFAHNEIATITEFAINNYFKHLKLYQHSFCTTNELDLSIYRSFADELSESHNLSLADAVEGPVPPPAPETQQQEPSTEASSATAADGTAAPAAASAPAIPSLASHVDSRAFSDPEEQTLFERAMAREPIKLNAELGDRLKAQQEDFAKRLQDLESKAGGKASARKPTGAR